jgi:proline iminopeptidase
MPTAQYFTWKKQKLFVNTIGEGNPIVFLHGGPGSDHRFFLPHILPLSRKYQLVLYDQRGCGKSQAAHNDHYTMDEEVHTLEELRKHLNLERMNLFGESWGSILALLYATTYPERVNKLFLTATIGIDANGIKAFEKELLKKISIKDKWKLLVMERKMKKGNAAVEDILHILDPYYVFKESAMAKIEKTYLNQTVNHDIGEDISKNYDITAELGKLEKIPIFIAQGSHDILPPHKIKKLLTNFLPQAELHEIEDCGHWTFVEKPDEINRLVETFFK